MFILGFTLCAIYSEFEQLYDMHPPQYHSEWFHCPKNPLSFIPLSNPPSLSPLPQPPATTAVSTFSPVLPFPECHGVGVVQYVAFPDFFLSSRNMHLRSTASFWCLADSKYLTNPSCCDYYHQHSYYLCFLSLRFRKEDCGFPQRLTGPVCWLLLPICAFLLPIFCITYFTFNLLAQPSFPSKVTAFKWENGDHACQVQYSMSSL